MESPLTPVALGRSVDGSPHVGVISWNSIYFFCELCSVAPPWWLSPCIWWIQLFEVPTPGGPVSHSCGPLSPFSLIGFSHVTLIPVRDKKILWLLSNPSITSKKQTLCLEQSQTNKKCIWLYFFHLELFHHERCLCDLKETDHLMKIFLFLSAPHVYMETQMCSHLKKHTFSQPCVRLCSLL